MSTWKLLLATGCLLFAASPAGATSDYGTYSGTFPVVVGTCTVSQTPDHRLQVSNLGSSGQDGVDFHLSNLDGCRCPLTSSVSDADNGASVSLSYRWSLVSAPAGSRATRLSVAATPGGVAYTPTFASLAAAARWRSLIMMLSPGCEGRE